MGRYRPPDADPRTTPFNTSKRLDRRRASSLTVRFELPFHLVCLSCSSSLPQGRRFNAVKSTVGTYLSTKVYRFDCKCPCCSSRFSVETDPQRSQYVVGSGARRKIEDWNPAEHGGFPIFDTDTPDAPDAPAEEARPGDAFASVEKESREKDKAKERQKRLQELEAAQEVWCDPAAENARLRRGFRREKRKRVRETEGDREVKSRIGWGEERVLLPSPGEEEQARDGRAWREAKASSTKTSSVMKSSGRDERETAAQKLQARLVANTKTKRDPFLREMREQSASSSSNRLLRSSTASSSSKHT